MADITDGGATPASDLPPPAPTGAAGQAWADGWAVTYDGKAGKLFGLGLKIFFLSLLTLGFYRFWGKTEIRRYLWSRLGLIGDRLEYTGTGTELFLGFLIALAVLIPLGAVSYASEFYLAGESPVVYGLVATAQYCVILFLIGYATFRARRYRLSRTVLRGIRFWQTGSNVGYAFRWLGYLALTAVSLGFARPVGDAGLYRYMMGHTWFGSRSFDANPNAGGLMGPWILCLILTPFTLGLSLLWYSAFKIRYLTARTRYQDLALSLPVSFRNLFGIYLPYYLVMAVLLALFYGVVTASILPIMMTQGAPADPAAWMDENFLSAYIIGTVAAFVIFGLVSPVFRLVLVTHRMTGLIARRLAIAGDADFDAVVQVAARQPKRGEGLADALDVGGGLEVGF